MCINYKFSFLFTILVMTAYAFVFVTHKTMHCNNGDTNRKKNKQTVFTVCMLYLVNDPYSSGKESNNSINDFVWKMKLMEGTLIHWTRVSHILSRFFLSSSGFCFHLFHVQCNASYISIQSESFIVYKFVRMLETLSKFMDFNNPRKICNPSLFLKL